MSQSIAITVKDKIASTQFDEVVSFNSVYDLNFTFDAEWDDFPTRVAVALWEGGCAQTVFTGSNCRMPLISAPACDGVSLGVYSISGEDRIASSMIRLRCRPGAHGTPHVVVPSLLEQLYALIGQQDWTIFSDKITPGVYSAVQVNKAGFVTAGWRLIEVGETGQTMPGSTLAEGGIFFRKETNGTYTACRYESGTLTPLLSSAQASLAHGLTVGSKTFDGTAAVTITKNDLGLPDLALSGDWEDIENNPIPTPSSLYAGNAVVVNEAGTGFEFGSAPVSSVNGQSGAVTITKNDLGLPDLAISGEWEDIANNPIPTPSTLNAGNAIVVNEAGTGFEFGGAPVSSVNGQSGAVTITKNDLGLPDLALSGDWEDIANNPIPTPSVNDMGKVIAVDGTGAYVLSTAGASASGITYATTLPTASDSSPCFVFVEED